MAAADFQVKTSNIIQAATSLQFAGAGVGVRRDAGGAAAATGSGLSLREQKLGVSVSSQQVVSGDFPSGTSQTYSGPWQPSPGGTETIILSPLVTVQAAFKEKSPSVRPGGQASGTSVSSASVDLLGGFSASPAPLGSPPAAASPAWVPAGGFSSTTLTGNDSLSILWNSTTTNSSIATNPAAAPAALAAAANSPVAGQQSLAAMKKSGITGAKPPAAASSLVSSDPINSSNPHTPLPTAESLI
eukprot:TRINITY_DN5943_c0_g1_i2.p1 TRINITY_DN5943_c0_g1~~TRINITY_DN5943_c0_g1_i2.p1  ORF type:complete len:253 (-),score=69.08 TRINITY_DN5943_c0_g1_i2:246-977(-)